MKIAFYIGSHTKDTPGVRLGWWLTRITQKGRWAQVTHVEAIHKENKDGTVTIASASIRDGGVRTKENVRLNPDHWIVMNVPQWDLQDSIQWFKEHDGEPYDIRGAFASPMPFQWAQKGRWFCNQAVGARFLDSAEIFGPAQFAAICYSFSTK